MVNMKLSKFVHKITPKNILKKWEKGLDKRMRQSVLRCRIRARIEPI